MKLSRKVFAVVLLLSSLSGNTQAPTGGIVLPGKSVAGVKLGEDLGAFERIFPKHENIDEELPLNDCGVDGYHWVDVDLGATGVYAYTKDGAIVQFSVQTPRLSLANGVRVGATEDNLKRAYPHGKSYVLLYSANAVMGGKDLIYWVDESAGVAFELYWNRKKSQRLVSGIEVFQKSTKYLPEGCISAPQIWKTAK